MFDVRAVIGRPEGGVRLVIADYNTTDVSKWRITNIPAAQIFSISLETGAKWKRWLKRLARRMKLGAVIGAMLLANWISAKTGLSTETHGPLIMGAITSAIASSFKTGLGKGLHDFTVTTGHSVKTALYTSSATLGASTTAYSATNEISGTGYTATGVVMANVTPVLSGTTCIFDWADAVWTTATFTANGSLSYDNTASGTPAIFVIAFGSDQTVTAGTFTIQWPVADASNAIIRF